MTLRLALCDTLSVPLSTELMTPLSYVHTLAVTSTADSNGHQSTVLVAQLDRLA
jgi:hypothetical protein